MNRKHEIEHEVKVQSDDWKPFNFKLTWTKDSVTGCKEVDLYNDQHVNVSYASSGTCKEGSVTFNPHLVFKCKGGHTTHIGINDWNIRTRPSNLSLGYWFKNNKLSIGSDTSVDVKEHSLNYVRLLCVLNLTDLKLVHESSLVNSARTVYDKNFILGSILDYNDKLKLFGNFAAELTQSNVDLAVGFQYALDEATTVKGKIDNRYVVALSLLKNYRRFIDFGFIVRMSTLSKKTKDFNPKFNFGLSLNVSDI
jgi:hypothetical protein